jgi:hypothetical protein
MIREEDPSTTKCGRRQTQPKKNKGFWLFNIRYRIIHPYNYKIMQSNI